MQQKKQPLTPRDKPQKPDKVKVILRVRPFFPSQDPQQFISPQPNNSISINKPGMTSFMKFSYVQHVANHQDNQQCQKEMVLAVDEAIKCIFQGIDSTIFAYGQTGAGKTYTIIGNCPENDSDSDFYKQTICNIERGILPRSLEIIFNEHKRKKNSRITISFYQIYNEKIYDLLVNNLKPLEIRQSKGEISISGLAAIEVVSLKQAINYLAQGIKNRVTTSTSVNIKSSRSHSIFHLKYEKLIVNPETKEHQVVVAHLRVVDLAGSEKFNIPPDISQAQKDLRLLELRSINGSLSKLGHCISALTIQSRTHIPVRDSKLTRILSQSLLGPGKIRLIICVSPSFSSMNQTTSTLQFADRVKKAIFQRPSITKDEKKKYIDFEQYSLLQQQLQIQRQKRQQLQKIILQLGTNPTQLTLLKQNQLLKQEIVSLKQQIKIYSNQQKINSSRINQQINTFHNKSLSPGYNQHNKSISQHPTNNKSHMQPGNTKKGRSILGLKQDGTSQLKMTKTPPKKGEKITKQFDSKSQNMSIDEPQHHQARLSKKGSKAQGFDRKVKLFMEKPDHDGDLEEKVKKKLMEIKHQISMGNRQWLQSEDLNEDELLWK